MARSLKALGRIALVATASLLITLGVTQTSWHRALESMYYDWMCAFAGVRSESRHTSLIAVDDKTLLALKDDPLAFWAPHFAKAIEVLTRIGVKAIGLDFLYQVSAEGWLKKLNLPDSEISRNYDAPFRAALAGGKVILITFLVENGERQTLLTPPLDQILLLPNGVQDLGIGNLFPDEDKYIRHFRMALDADPQKPGLSLAAALALRAGSMPYIDGPSALAGRTMNRDVSLRAIGYVGPPGTIPVISMSALLAPDALQNPALQLLKDKIVIISANNSGSADQHFTPYSRGAHAGQMTGGEIHANIVETLLTGRYPKDMPKALEIGGLSVLLILITWGFFELSLVAGVALFIVATAAIILPAYAFFRYDWVVPVAGIQTSFLASFLIALGVRLTGEEKERARTREIFGKYVSKEVVDLLLSDARIPDLGGEALNVTVLFSDIRGFTTISEKLGAHEVVEMLNAYFTRVCEPILAQGGTVDKYIGDAVMAVFGSPLRHPDHARRALRAALGMAREAEQFKKWMLDRFPDRGLSEFGVGIGLHTGEAVIGDIGTPKRKEFTAIGDTVNAASRLESATKELGCVILASRATVMAGGTGVRTGKHEEIRVKGKAEPLEVFEIVGIEET